MSLFMVNLMSSNGNAHTLGENLEGALSQYGYTLQEIIDNQNKILGDWKSHDAEV